MDARPAFRQAVAPVMAAYLEKAKTMPIPFLACMAASALYYHLPPRVLPSIQAVEGGAPGMVRANTNGTRDFGVMQVNSTWVPLIAQITRLPMVDVATRLAMKPCFNIAAAAMILRSHLNRDGGDLLRAVGDYHSRTPELNTAYARKVLGAAGHLFAGSRSG